MLGMTEWQIMHTLQMQEQCAKKTNACAEYQNRSMKTKLCESLEKRYTTELVYGQAPSFRKKSL